MLVNIKTTKYSKEVEDIFGKQPGALILSSSLLLLLIFLGVYISTATIQFNKTEVIPATISVNKKGLMVHIETENRPFSERIFTQKTAIVSFEEAPFKKLGKVTGKIIDLHQKKQGTSTITIEILDSGIANSEAICFQHYKSTIILPVGKQSFFSYMFARTLPSAPTP